MNIKVTKQSLNPYELLKQRYASNPIVTRYGDDWNTFAASQRLPQYLAVLDEYGKKGKKLSDLQSTYKSDFLTSDERLLALANDVMGDAVTKVTKKREVPDMAHSDEQGTYQRTDPTTGKPLYRTEEYETTDYEYTKNLLLDIANERENKYLATQASDAKSSLEKFKEFGHSTVASAVGGFVHGVASFAGDIQNLFTGIYDGFKAAAGTDIYTDKDKVFMDAFRARMATPLGYVTDIEDGFADLLMDPETGEYISNAARYIYSGFDSLGRMAPGLVLSATGAGIFGAGSKLASMTSQASHFMFYTSMAAGNMSELFQNPNLASRPTAELILNASLRAAVESAIETGLDKALGSTMVDSMMYGYNKIAIPKGAGSVYARLAKDALQEGTEEVLQDWSNYLINQAFGLMDENYKYLSEWNLQTMIDAFMMGAVMSLAGSGFRIMTTKRFDTGIAKTNKQGDIKYDKKGEIKTKKLGKFASYKYYYNIETLSQDLSQVIYDKSLTVQERTRLMGGVYTTLKTITDVFGSLGEERYNRAAQLLNAISENAVAINVINTDSYAEINKNADAIISKFTELKTFVSSKVTGTVKTKVEKANSFRELILAIKTNVALRQEVADKLGITAMQIDDVIHGKEIAADVALAVTKDSSKILSERAANELIKQINNLKVDSKVEGNPTFKKQLKESKITKIKDVFTKKSAEQQLKELTQKPVAQRTDEDNSVIAEIKAVSDILNNGNFKQVVTAEDGVNIAQDEDSKTLVAPRNIIRNCSTNEVFRTVAEQKLVEVLIATPQLKNTLNLITDIYSEFKNDATVTTEQALRALYFDNSFINMLLSRDNISKIVDLINKSDIIMDNISRNNAQDAIYKMTFTVARDNIAKALLVYYISSGDLGYRTLSIFTKNQKDYIYTKRMELDWVTRAENEQFIPTSKDITLFTNALNLVVNKIDTNTYTNLLSKFKLGNFGNNRNYSKAALLELQRLVGYKKYVTNEYNNIIYADNTTSLGRTFNAFMTAMGLDTIEQVSILPKNESLRETIETDFDGDPVAYYQQEFLDFSGYKLRFEYDVNEPDVSKRFSVDYALGAAPEYVATDIVADVFLEKELQNEDTSVKQKLTSYAPIEAQSFDSLGKAGEILLYKLGMTDIPREVRGSLTVNDVVQDISLLDEPTREKVSEIYGEFTSTSVEYYISDLLNHNFKSDKSLKYEDGISNEIIDLPDYYIAHATDGRVVLMKVLYADKLLVKDAITKLHALIDETFANRQQAKDYIKSKNYGPDETIRDEDKATIEKLRGSTPVSITELINGDLMTTDLKNIKVVGKVMRKGEGGYFDIDTDTIVVNVSARLDTILASLLHEYTHAVQDHNGLSQGFNPDIITKYMDKNTQAELLKEFRNYVPDIFSREFISTMYANDFIPSSELDMVSTFIYFNCLGEAEARGFAFDDLIQQYMMPVVVKITGDIIELTMPWGTKYTIDTSEKQSKVIYKQAKTKKPTEPTEPDAKDEPKLTGKEFGQAMNQKAGKTKRVKSEGRSFTFKEEASQSNMKYLWDAAHKKGKPYVLTDTRIKDMIIATTGIEDELDPEFMNRIKDGRMSTVSDILEYMRSYEQLTPKVKNTVNLINKYWFKNNYIKNATELEAMATKGAAILYATRSAIRQLIANEPELAEQLGLVEGLVKPMSPKDLMTVVAKLNNIPQFKTRYQQVSDGYEMLGKRSITVDTNAMRIALLNNFDGTIQSAAAVASWARSLAINQKLRDSSISIDAESDSKDGGSRSLSETIADANAEMSHELGEVWFNEIANTSREERENLVFENRRNEYIAKLQDSPKDMLLKDIKLIQKTLSSETDEEGNWISPLRQEIADMSDDDLNTAYLAYEYSAGIDFAELRNQIADQLIDAKGGTATRPRYKVVQRVKYLADKIKRLLTPDELKTFTEEYPELVYNDNGSYVLPREDIGDGKTKAVSIEKVLELEELFDELAKKAYAIKTARQRFLTAEDALAKAKETIKGLKAKVKAEREATKAAKAQAKLVYAKVRNNVEIAIVSETNVPDKLNVLLSTNFDKLADTKVKYLTTEGQQHTIKSLAKFTEDNAEILASMTNAEAKEFVSFFKNSTVITDGANTETVTTYNAVRLYTLAYIYKNATGEYSQFQLTADEMKAIEDMVLTRASSAGTEMSISRQVLEEFKPAEYIIKKLSTEVNIDFSEETINELAELTSKFSNKDFAKMSEADVKAATLENIAALKKVFQKMYDEGLAKYKDTHKFSVFNQLWKFQRMAMLSSPGTWLRNITSNCIITVANKASAVIGDATFKLLQKAENKFSKTKVAPRPTRNLTDAQKADVHFAENKFGYNGKLTSQEALDNNYELVMQRIDKQITAQNNFARSVIAAVKERYNPELLQKLRDTKTALQLDHEYRIADLEYKQNVADRVNVRRTMYGQYQITGTVIAEDAKTFVNDYILDSGFYDMISESINKYTAGDFTRTAKANENLAQMIVASIQSEIFNDETFKVPNWWKKISKAGDDASGLNMWNKIIYKAISDDPWVKKAFASYLGKILTEDDVNLTKGITKEVQSHIVDAYKMAAWDYMHKTNAFSAVEKTIRQYTTEGGYFIWKQLFPFAVSGWNWFKEGLNYTPLGLAKAIIDYAKLDKKVAKMSDDAAKGMGPSERFAGYIVKRNIGKGAIGTIGFIAGALLAGFGVAGIDEEDDKVKLRVGNVYIDISQLFGTQGILLGMVFANFFADDGVIAKSQGNNGFDVFMRCVGSFLDQVFLDSTFSDLYNTISYTQTFSDVLVDMTDSTLSSFIPNFLKVVNSATYNHKVKYSKGFLGMLERKVIQTIPGIAYAYPKQYDVYTGEIKWQYGSGWWGIFQKVANSALPIKVYPYSVSDIEKEAILNGVNKGQLTGNYDNIKAFTPAQVSKLNEYYGQLNSADLAELKANRKKYKVKDEKTGKYVELTYSKMTAKQKNNVISRIMEDNAEIAKIYVYTSSGGKYYAETETAFQTLRSLRIKNVFRATGSKKGFN